MVFAVKQYTNAYNTHNIKKNHQMCKNDVSQNRSENI